MSWTNKAVLAWGWILTPEEIATLPDEVYEEWLDKEWLIYSEVMDEKVFTYFSVDADESPKNVTDVTELVSEIGNEEIDKRVGLLGRIFLLIGILCKMLSILMSGLIWKLCQKNFLVVRLTKNLNSLISDAKNFISFFQANSLNFF